MEPDSSNIWESRKAVLEYMRKKGIKGRIVAVSYDASCFGPYAGPLMQFQTWATKGRGMVPALQGFYKGVK